MQDHTVDVIKRMKEIATLMNLSSEVMEAEGISAEEIEGMRYACLLFAVRVREAACSYHVYGLQSLYSGLDLGFHVCRV